MTSRHFAALLRAHGAALEAWPEADRRAALRALRRSARCRQLLAEAFAAEPSDPADTPASAALRARLQAGLARRMAPPAPPAPARLSLPAFRPAAFGFGALAASFALGAWLGLATPAAPVSPDLLTVAQITPLSLD